MPDHEFDELSELAKSVTSHDRERHRPPSQLWENIEAETNSEAAAAPAIEHNDTAAAQPEAPIDLTARRQIAETRQPLPRASLRRKVLAGVAAGIVFIAGLTLLDGGPPSTDTFIAIASNTDLPEEFDGTATATVRADAPATIEIAFSEEIPAGDPVELWLATENIDQLVSLGTVADGATDWVGAWPSGLDPNVHVIIDLSFEPDDGDPTHSGRSFLRGELQPS